MIRTFAFLAAFLTPLALSPQEGNDLKEKARRHKKDVTEIRGLEFFKEVEVGVYSRKDLLEFITKEMEKEFPREKAAKYQKAYAHFGLIPADLDLYDAVIDLYSSSIAGFYHPETKELRLIKPGDAEAGEAEMLKMMGIDLEAITLVHELCHAAQDQHFELSTLPMDDETNDDLISAVKGVIEGDASVVGWKYGLTDRFDSAMEMINAQFKSGTLPGKAGELPAFLRLSLTFPYGHGTDFVLEYVKSKEGQFETASALFKEFPTSTEQILHPEKYSGETKDWPVLLTFDDLSKTLGLKTEPILNNVHGEFGVLLLLKETKSASGKKARTASAGWDGDRYVIFEEDGQVFSIWLTTWDTEQDAQEFGAAYEKGLTKKHKFKEEDRTANKESAVWKKGDRRVLVLYKDKDVLVLDNVSEDVAKKAPEILTAAKRSELKTVPRKEKKKEEGKPEPPKEKPRKEY